MLIFRTEDDWNIIYPIFVATSTSPQHILDTERTIDAAVDYEVILKMEGASGLSLATTFKFVDAADAAAADAGVRAGASAGPPALPTPPPR